MREAAWRRALCWCVAVMLAAGCSTPVPKSRSYVVLLPVNGKVSGEVEVSNAQGSQVLNQSWQSTEIVGIGVAPAPPVVQDEAVVKAEIGSALAAMPHPPVHYILYFEHNKAVLTPESKRLLPEILKAVRDRYPAELSVVGHTDTVGSPQKNYQLGLLRANSLIAQLALAGIKPALVEIASHGEANLLIKTPDNTPEPRNRRIEVTIR